MKYVDEMVFGIIIGLVMGGVFGAAANSILKTPIVVFDELAKCREANGEFWLVDNAELGGSYMRCELKQKELFRYEI